MNDLNQNYPLPSLTNVFLTWDVSIEQKNGSVRWYFKQTVGKHQRRNGHLERRHEDEREMKLAKHDSHYVEFMETVKKMGT